MGAVVAAARPARARRGRGTPYSLLIYLILCERLRYRRHSHEIAFRRAPPRAPGGVFFFNTTFALGAPTLALESVSIPGGENWGIRLLERRYLAGYVSVPNRRRAHNIWAQSNFRMSLFMISQISA